MKVSKKSGGHSSKVQGGKSSKASKKNEVKDKNQPPVYAQDGQDFEQDAPVAKEAAKGKKSSKKAKAKKADKAKDSRSSNIIRLFTHVGTIKTGVKESSDVCRLPGDTFLVVSDLDSTAHRVDLQGKHVKVVLAGIEGESGLEGIAYDEARQLLFALREEQDELHVFKWDATGTQQPEPFNVFSIPIGGAGNKGGEGMVSLPASASPTGEGQLLFVKEKQPHRLCMLAADGSGKIQDIVLDKELTRVCTDFSGLTVHPQTGNLWMFSDETGRAAEFKLVPHAKGGFQTEFIQPVDLVDGKGKPLLRGEGIAFGSTGDLFILTENQTVLHHYKPV